MKDFTLVLEGEIDEEEEREEKELSEHEDAVGERGGEEEGEGGEKQGKELLAFELRSIASSSSSTLV